MMRTRHFATALRESLRHGYDRTRLRADLLAGVTVGIVALPLAMALAIASGVPPQHGLYTVVIAGAVIALTGGSRVNISGPTAAFVVVLLPITQKFGLGGLLLASVMAGVILLAMGLGRLGRFIELVPYPVTIGFTAGIGVVIATLQLKDFLGLDVGASQGHFLSQLWALLQALPSLHWQDCLIGLLTLAVLLLWPRWVSRIPGHLAALLVGSVAALLLTRWLPGFEVATIGSRFQYHIGGVIGHGIPPLLPHFDWPWRFSGADGKALALDFDTVQALLGPAFAIAMLGAIESLLCAVVADGMAGTRHDSNGELIGQGLGNIVAPFFGGIPATAAIARTATNVRAGAVSPLAAVIHALVVLGAMVSLAGLLGYIPMAALAALLLVVAWNMSEARHFVRVIRIAPGNDILVLLTCFGLTVLFDMVIAVTVGIGMAALLFVKRTIDLTEGRLVERPLLPAEQMPEQVALYDINGPLFFGAAHKALGTLMTVTPGLRVVVLDMRDVSLVDMTGLVALESLIEAARRHHLGLVFCGLTPRLKVKLRRIGIRKQRGQLEFANNIDEGIERALNMRDATATAPTHASVTIRAG
ncbi:MAG: C4-dicarboxylic acid transporter DauA [Rhodocyclaceae bacterium]|nr:C4-dicarboxylic acid transporter DauA [Rhodocyclaceae bacterium]